MKKFPLIFIIFSLFLVSPTHAQEALKLRESEQGLLLEFTQSQKIEVKNITEIENPSRLILAIENCLLAEDFQQDLKGNALFSKIKIKSQGSNCQLILNITGISWAGNNISKLADNQLTFGMFSATKSNSVSTIQIAVEPIATPAASLTPEASPTVIPVTSPSIAPQAASEETPAPTTSTEAPVQITTEPMPSPAASIEAALVAEINPSAPPAAAITSPSPVDEKVLRKINFNPKEQALILEFGARPAYELKKKSENIYELIIDDFSASNPQLLLPYYAPTTLAGFEKLVVADPDDLEILIFTTKNYKINANTIDNSVILTAESIQ